MIKVNGTVLFASNEDNKSTITIKLTEEQAVKINEAIEYSDVKHKYSPVKVGESGKYEGIPYFKASSNFPVKAYDEKGNEVDGFEIGTLGEGSEVEIAVACKENTYRGKTGIVARLSSIKIHKFVEFVPYNAFEDEECATF